MKLEIKRKTLLIIPENDQDISFIEDTLGVTKNGEKTSLERVNDVSLGFNHNDKFVLKLGKE